MAFIYQVSLDIRSDQRGDLAIGGSLERVLSYLRSHLPSDPGYVSSRAMNAVDPSPTVQLVVESVWETWDDLVAHRDSGKVEAKVLVEFGHRVPDDAMSVRVYEEVA